MVAPLRHRQTKGAATDMPGLLPPRHIPTLPKTDPGAGYQASDFIHTGARPFSRNALIAAGAAGSRFPKCGDTALVQHPGATCQARSRPWQTRSGVSRNELLRLTANYEAIEPRERYCHGRGARRTGLLRAPLTPIDISQ